MLLLRATACHFLQALFFEYVGFNPMLKPYQSVALGSTEPHQVLCASLDAKRITNKEIADVALLCTFGFQ